MNNRGQVWMYSLMLGLTIIILALALAPSVQSFVNDAMNPTVGDLIGLDCDNESISNFDKGTCVITDFSSFYIIGSFILIGGAVIVAKIYF